MYIRPEASLGEHIFDTRKMELTSSIPSGPSGGTQYAKDFLDEIPGEGGSSNFREVRDPTLNVPVATIRATYRAVERSFPVSAPSVILSDHCRLH